MLSETVPRSVLIMAGGTGGHVFPALAAAQCLRDKGINVEWLGTRRGIEARLVTDANIALHEITVSGLRGKGLFGVIKAVFQVAGALLQTLKVLHRLKPVCVLGMGGFVAGPGGVAAWLSRRPLVIHEQNAVAGTTNTLLAKIASRVLLGYPIGLGGSKGLHIGNPVRANIAGLPAPEQRAVGQRPTLRLLVLGGSLGAKPLNDLVPLALQAIQESERPEVWHQTGQQHIDVVQSSYQQHGVSGRVDAFIDDMSEAYQWADLVLCRAGALTVAELTAVGVAAILVPLPHAIDDHQTENARWLVDNQAGLMLVQSTMTVERLVEILMAFHGDRQRLMAMAKAARALAKVDAAEQVAAQCLEVASE